MPEADTIRLWRMVKAERAYAAWDGEGAHRYGGRWNSRGQRMVYTSRTLSLALLEILVHLDPAAPTPAFVAVPIDVPVKDITTLPLDAPARSRIEFRHTLTTTRAIGDRWLAEQGSPCLAVPSALVPIEHNVLLNPAHPAARNHIIGRPRPFPSISA